MIKLRWISEEGKSGAALMAGEMNIGYVTQKSKSFYARIHLPDCGLDENYAYSSEFAAREAVEVLAAHWFKLCEGKEE